MSSPEPQVLLTDLAFGESPRWHEDRLWFSDWGANEIVAVDLEGKAEVMARIEGMPFSIDWLPDGRLVVTAPDRRSVVRREPDGTFVPHADPGAAGEFGYNEIVVDDRGNAYVNSPGFDLMSGQDPVPGWVDLVTPDGTVRRVADGVMFPNGMAVTADGATLIVAESYGNRLTAFPILPDGGLGERWVWADLPGGYPDGICVDAEGAVWYADVPNRHCVRVREGGEVLQTVAADRGCFACMLGGPDGRTLFVVATEWNGTGGMGEGARTGRILTVEAPAPHAGRP